MLIAVLTSLALFAALGSLGQSAHAATPTPPSAVEEVALPEGMTMAEIKVLAREAQKSMTPAERKQMQQHLAELKKHEEASAGEVSIAAVPYIVYWAVSFILAYGLPALIRWAPNAYQTVFNYWNRRITCQALRDRGSWWGWSSVCWGTY